MKHTQSASWVHRRSSLLTLSSSSSVAVLHRSLFSTVDIECITNLIVVNRTRKTRLEDPMIIRFDADSTSSSSVYLFYFLSVDTSSLQIAENHTVTFEKNNNQEPISFQINFSTNYLRGSALQIRTMGIRYSHCDRFLQPLLTLKCNLVLFDVVMRGRRRSTISEVVRWIRSTSAWQVMASSTRMSHFWNTSRALPDDSTPFCTFLFVTDWLWSAICLCWRRHLHCSFSHWRCETTNFLHLDEKSSGSRQWQCVKSLTWPGRQRQCFSVRE